MPGQRVRVYHRSNDFLYGGGILVYPLESLSSSSLHLCARSMDYDANHRTRGSGYFESRIDSVLRLRNGNALFMRSAYMLAHL